MKYSIGLVVKSDPKAQAQAKTLEQWLIDKGHRVLHKTDMQQPSSHVTETRTSRSLLCSGIGW